MVFLNNTFLSTLTHFADLCNNFQINWNRFDPNFILCFIYRFVHQKNRQQDTSLTPHRSSSAADPVLQAQRSKYFESDSEYESEIVESRISKSERRNPEALNLRSDSEAENVTRRDQAKKSKKKSNNRAPSKSDSEDYQPSRRSKAKTTKRKSTTSRSSNTPKRRNTKKEEDLFGLVSEEEEVAAHANASRRAPSSQLPSSINSKVADGPVLRRAQLSGRYYAELRLYCTRDALDIRPETRYTKALVTLKLQLDPDQPEWDLLQKFLRSAKTTYFADSVPVYFNNKID